jgi:short subunit dehydrogenase-like uncharacterized protein
MAPKPYDIVIYGATGFTGRLAVAYVAKQYRAQTVKWAIAGRSQSKLNAIAKKEGADCGIIVAEVEITLLVIPMICEQFIFI